MDYLFSLLLLGLNLYNYEHRLNRILFFIAGCVLFCALFYFCYKKSKSFMTACLMTMCHTWQISWYNVFGRDAKELQVTWFYIVGVLILGYFLGHLKAYKNRNVSAVMLGVFGSIAILFVYPLLISPSITNALREFIMIGFFLVLTFIGFLMSDTISRENRRMIVNAYIFCVFVTSILLIFQYVYYSIFGVSIFKYSVGNYMGSLMVSSNLLMEDTSSATIMLATGVFYMLEYINRKEKRLLYVIMIAVTVVGMAFTTRRTSIISLAVCLLLYVLIEYRGVLKKTSMMMAVVSIVMVMLLYLARARSIEDFSQLLYSNGRFTHYYESMLLFFKHPLGVGYDNHHLSQFFSEVIPHNTFLRWLNMGGILFAPLMLLILIYMVRKAHQKGLRDDFWALICSLLAMNFIPDILNARFFVIPCMLTMMTVTAKKRSSQELIQDKFRKPIVRTPLK